MTSLACEIGSRMVIACEAFGLSQRDLARYAGISQPTIHRIETGQREASILELSALADACSVLVADLKGNNTVADDVLCTGGTTAIESLTLSEYMVFALGLTKRLDELGVPESA